MLNSARKKVKAEAKVEAEGISFESVLNLNLNLNLSICRLTCLHRVSWFDYGCRDE